MFIRSTHIFIDDNTAPCIQFQACIFRKLTIRTNANGKYHHISRYIFTAFKFYCDSIVFILKCRNTVTKIQFHSVFTDMFMQNLCHFKIKRCHDLLCSFYQTDFQTGMTKIFRHFNSDKTAADDSGIFHFAALHK